MLHKLPEDVRRTDKLWKWSTRLALASAGILLIYGFVQYLMAAAAAVNFPYQLDYGEGIVWQQMRLIMAGQGYGEIDHFPAIVFHYPPLFHVLSAVIASATAMDQLAAGRLLSITTTMLAAGFISLIVRHLTLAEAGRLSAWISGTFAAFIMLSIWPITMWSILMRVDMLSLALTFGGVYLALRSITQPGAIYLAALCFLAAIFTKQTAIAAPAAVFSTLLFLRPRIAWAGIATCLGLGLAVAGALTWITDGGFFHHVLLYNINRIELHRVIYIFNIFGTHFIYIAIAGAGIAYRIRHRLPAYRNLAGWQDLRQRLNAEPLDVGFAMLVLHLLFATLMTTTILKSGASLNYLIEWGSLIALFAGIAVADSVTIAIHNFRSNLSRLPALLMPIGIAIQAFLLPDAPNLQYQMQSERKAELAGLVRLIQAAHRPVISDDMVLLLRGNKAVQWEPAIFAELASQGMWDERPFIDRIRKRQFAFFITDGDRGDQVFDSRYNPAVAEAIKAAYPVKREIAGYNVRFPAEPLE